MGLGAYRTHSQHDYMVLCTKCQAGFSQHKSDLCVPCRTIECKKCKSVFVSNKILGYNRPNNVCDLCMRYQREMAKRIAAGFEDL